MSISKRIKRIVSSILYAIAPHRFIIFESYPDFGDNSRAVFDEMVNRHLNEKYTFVWVAQSKNIKIPAVKNLKYIPLSGLKRILYAAQAKAIICCNYYYTAISSRQFCMYLDHGTPLKDVSNVRCLPEMINCCLSSSEQTIAMREKVLHITTPGKYVALGFPRNDAFGKKPISLDAILGNHYKKVIVWYPTFRQHSDGKRNDGGNALPLIHNETWAHELNDALVKDDVLLILKPHFAQNVNLIKNLHLSNILLINDAFFSDNNITSYEFLNACDALVTDYSSVYYDYILCNKPIALIWEDIEAYKNGIGLIDNYEYLCKGGEKIYTVEELIGFIFRVVNDIDLLKVERNEICKVVHYSTDGHNAQRVTDFIMQKAKL